MEQLGVQAPCLLGLVHLPTMAPTPVPSRSLILNLCQKHGVSSLPTLGFPQAPSLQLEPTASVLILNIMDKCRSSQNRGVQWDLTPQDWYPASMPTSVRGLHAHSLCSPTTPTHCLPNIPSQTPIPSHPLIIFLQNPGPAWTLIPPVIPQGSSRLSLCVIMFSLNRSYCGRVGAEETPQSRNLSTRVPSFWGVPRLAQALPRLPCPHMDPALPQTCPVISRAPMPPLHHAVETLRQGQTRLPTGEQHYPDFCPRCPHAVGPSRQGAPTPAVAIQRSAGWEGVLPCALLLISL